MDWLWAMLIVVVWNAALFAGLVLLTHAAGSWRQTRESR